MFDAVEVAGANTSRAMRIAVTALIVLVLCALTVYLGNTRLTSGTFRVDGAQNLKLAYKLANHGRFSTMSREPFPPAVTAVWLRFAFPDLSELKFVDEKDELGRPVIKLERANGENAAIPTKRVNLLWSVLAVLLGFLAARILTGSLIAATAAGVAIMLTIGREASLLDVLYTDLAGSVPVLASSLCLALYVRNDWWGWGILAGLFLGLTILTKAIVLYAAPAILITIALLLRAKTGTWRPVFNKMAILLTVLSLVVGPWVARNVALFDKPQIAGRDVKVLYHRLVLDRMTPEEYRASFYAWAPEQVRPALERMFGFVRADIEPGGVAQRLNRENRGNYHVEANVEVSKVTALLQERLRAEGRRKDSILVEREMRLMAISEIGQKPLQHLLVSIPLAWRGMWVEGLPFWLAPLALAALLCAFFWGAWSRRYDLTAFATTSTFTLGMYILTTHNLPRYNTPFVPVMLVCLVVLIYLLLTYLTGAMRRERKRDDAALISKGSKEQQKPNLVLSRKTDINWQQA